MKIPFSMSARMPREGPPQIYGFRIYLLVISATWASAMYGYDSAFIGGTLALPAFKSTFGLEDATDSEAADISSNVVSCFQAGAFFGALIGFFFAERYGRKLTIIGSGVVFSVGAIVQLIGLMSLMYLGRVLTGLGVGASSTLIPIYIAECSPALIRGRLVGIFEIMLQTALVFGFWVSYGVERNISGSDAMQWRVPVAVQLIPAGLLILSMPWMIESPRWLASKNRMEQAHRSLAWVRNLPLEHAYVVNELADIQAAVNHELESTGGDRSFTQILRECAAPGVRNRIIISVLLMLLQNLTGINAINYYSPTIFRSIGFTGTSVQLLATGVYGLVKMITTLVFMIWIVDRFGRRPPLLVGAVGAALAMFYLAIYSQLSNSFHAIPPSDAGARTAVAMVYIYAIFYGFSWNGIPWIFASEVLPTRVRTIGMMAAVCMQWLAQFMIVYSLPHMVETVTYGTFYFFAACTVVALVFAWLFVPETKGVVLEEMDLLFGAGVSVFAERARRNYDECIEARRAEMVVDEQSEKGMFEKV
ncbi:general substrate transporter [Aspergillus karnatakaensis]|uniref:sugar porter family MFS transporter n=1 Tax=Aspergillus karnatakaensis TaxID=1810916 RepID=UPI003CCD3989